MRRRTSTTTTMTTTPPPPPPSTMATFNKNEELKHIKKRTRPKTESINNVVCRISSCVFVFAMEMCERALFSGILLLLLLSSITIELLTFFCVCSKNSVALHTVWCKCDVDSDFLACTTPLSWAFLRFSTQKIYIVRARIYWYIAVIAGKCYYSPFLSICMYILRCNVHLCMWVCVCPRSLFSLCVSTLQKIRCAFIKICVV